MTIFWLVCITMLVVALLIILMPSLRQYNKSAGLQRKDFNISIHKEHLAELEKELNSGNLTQEEYDNAFKELELELIHDVAIDEEKKGTEFMKNSKQTVITLSILLPVFVISVYVLLGNVEQVENPVAEVTSPQSQDSEMHSIIEMVDKLSKRLELQPDDANGWRMLGRSYLVLNRYNDAVMAYRKAYELTGDDPELLADYSEALILSNNNRFTDESVRFIELALQKNPDEPKALWMAGYLDVETGNLPAAVDKWERLLTQLPPGSEQSANLQEHVNQLKQEMGVPVSGSAAMLARNEVTTNTTPTGEEETLVQVDVDVSLDASLTEKTEPGDTVFIYAKAAKGPPMPLAILRKKVSDLPIKTTLDDTMAMSPAMKMSNFNEIVIGARVSKSGNAMPQTGDLQGLSDVISLQEVSGVKVIINQILQ